MTDQPELVLFDVVETLFSLEAVGRRLRTAGAGEDALEHWFAGFLRDGFALAASGGYRPFREVASSGVRRTLRSSGVTDDDRAVASVLDAFSVLDPYPDVEPALRRLREAGVRTMTLSNGGAAAAAALLRRAGLDTLVDGVLSVDEVGAWKPRPEPYLHACFAGGAAPERTALVAVHGWDVHGARRAGLMAGWCARLENVFADDLFESPTVRGATLVEVVEALLALRVRLGPSD